MNPSRIHKGLDHEMEFKGLKPPFLYYMIGVGIGTILLFLLLSGIGLAPILAAFFTLCPVLFLSGKILVWNREMGPHGLMKRSAFKRVPFCIRVRGRSPFRSLSKTKKGKLTGMRAACFHLPSSSAFL
ncbi:DUF4133 domain-containing protein [Algoriphagus sp.]|uniref:DUF4133 domain-containing protein n=1 Tax=Algoriphagus sp. TaxID=1872435 RepID=UPI002636418C|nr:DUF4133 domain-containing protein [Algoriphagus sp.]